MSDFLVIAGVPVPVAEDEANEAEPRMIGAEFVSFNNNLRSSMRSPKREFTFRAPLLTVAELATLLAAAPHGSFRDCSGDALGGTLHCRVKYTNMQYNANGNSFLRTPTIQLSEA